MWTGTVESIHIASAAEATTQSVDEAQAIPGVGLDGDRYAKRQGTFFKPLPDFELTLIEAEAVEALKRDYGMHITAGEARRNLVTRGVRLCEPCDHLQRLTGRPVLKGLRHRGGLRAQILTQGTIHVGDVISCR